MGFNLCKTFYRDIPNCNGIYLLTFPNQKKYIGSSCHLATRIIQHFNMIQKQVFDWHYEAWEDLDVYSYEHQQSLETSFFRDTEIRIQITSTIDEARLLEQEALYEIYQNHMIDKYYNTQYYLKQEDKYKCFNII